MIHRIAHQVAAFGLAVVFTISILSSIDMLAGHPAEQSVMAAEHAASQVVQSTSVNANDRTGG